MGIREAAVDGHRAGRGLGNIKRMPVIRGKDERASTTGTKVKTIAPSPWPADDARSWLDAEGNES